MDIKRINSCIIAEIRSALLAHFKSKNSGYIFVPSLVSVPPGAWGAMPFRQQQMPCWIPLTNHRFQKSDESV